MTEDHATTNVHELEDAMIARWLTRALARSRARTLAGPPAAAIERMRLQVFGEASGKKRSRRLAA